VAQVFALADRMPQRYRAMVLVTAFGCLRWGEVVGLQRQDVDLTRGTVRVRQAVTEQRGVGLTLGPPKSRAGKRVVSLPAPVLASLRFHLAEYVGNDTEAFVFTGPAGRLLWRGNFNKLVGWPEVVAAIGRPGLHFHDLRHTGNTFPAATGASLRDLMARMGHDSPDAALIYQHATSEADRAIAAALGEAIDKARGDNDDQADGPDDGAAGVPARVR
jgi:integrase